MFFMYLEEMKNAELLDIYKTAGLNVVYIDVVFRRFVDDFRRF